MHSPRPPPAKGVITDQVSDVREKKFSYENQENSGFKSPEIWAQSNII